MACTFAHIGMDPFMEKFNMELGESNKGRLRQESNEIEHSYWSKYKWSISSLYMSVLPTYPSILTT
jgi:hypothetical protein